MRVARATQSPRLLRRLEVAKIHLWPLVNPKAHTRAYCRRNGGRWVPPDPAPPTRPLRPSRHYRRRRRARCRPRSGHQPSTQHADAVTKSGRAAGSESHRVAPPGSVLLQIHNAPFGIAVTLNVALGGGERCVPGKLLHVTQAAASLDDLLGHSGDERTPAGMRGRTGEAK